MQFNPEINTGPYYVIEGIKGRFILPASEVGTLPTGSQTELVKLGKKALSDLEEALNAFTEYQTIQGINYIALQTGVVARMVTDWCAGPSPLRGFVTEEEAEQYLDKMLMQAIVKDEEIPEEEEEEEEDDYTDDSEVEDDELSDVEYIEEDDDDDEIEEEEEKTVVSTGSLASVVEEEATLDDDPRAVVIKQVTPKYLRLCYGGLEFDTAQSLPEAKELCYDWIDRSGLQKVGLYLMQDNTVKKL